MSLSDPDRQLLRHTVATFAYRAGKVVRGTPESVGDFQALEGARTPRQILTHICDLLDWALSIARGEQHWHNSEPLPWSEEIQRCFAGLEALDAYLASDQPFALTHIGQIAMLRRLAGAPMRAKNFVAKIANADQPVPVYEF